MGNVSMMTGVALLFRYADFIHYLGGTEWHLGWIVGIGMIGSLVTRFFFGDWIDRYGPGRIWLGSLGLLVLSCFGHLWVHSCDSPLIYLLRLAYCTALAGIFSAAMTFISSLAPTIRMAEMIGMLGTSGFVGMLFGTQLGDLLFAAEKLQSAHVQGMFIVTGLLGMVAMFFVALATAGYPHQKSDHHPPLWQLIWRYFPGTITLVGIAMGISISLPGVFIRPFASQLGITRIGLFFGVYAVSAVVTRLLTRRWPERFGQIPMVFAGLGLVIVSQLLWIAVRHEWMFVLPGLTYGLAHALFFPSTVAIGAQSFPRAHRGLGTTLMLACYDAGVLIGSPLAGSIIRIAESLNLPAYPVMLLCMSGVLTLIGVVYAVSLIATRPKQGTCRLEPDVVPAEQQRQAPQAEVSARCSVGSDRPL